MTDQAQQPTALMQQSGALMMSARDVVRELIVTSLAHSDRAAIGAAEWLRSVLASLR